MKKRNKYQYDQCVLESTLNQMKGGKETASRNPTLLREGGDIEETTEGGEKDLGGGFGPLRTVFMWSHQFKSTTEPWAAGKYHRKNKERERNLQLVHNEETNAKEKRVVYYCDED